MVIGESETLVFDAVLVQNSREDFNQVQTYVVTWALSRKCSKLMQKLKSLIAKAIIEDLT